MQKKAKNIREIKKAVKIIAVCFNWADTKQGVKYWADVARNLIDIAVQLNQTGGKTNGNKIKI